MNRFKHTFRFVLALLILAIGIGAVYYFLNRSYAEWKSPLMYIPSTAVGLIEVKHAEALPDAMEWSSEFSLNEGIGALIKDISSHPQGIKFEKQSMWIVENGSDDLIILPVGYGKDGEALAFKWNSKFPELKFLFQEPYAIYGSGNLTLPEEGNQLAHIPSFACVNGTTSFDSKCHYFFRVDQVWTALDDMHGSESSMIAGFQCSPLHLFASQSDFTFQKVFTNARGNADYWFKAVHAGNPLSLLSYLDSLRPQDARNAFLGLRMDQEAHANASVIEWMTNNTTGELAMANFGSDKLNGIGMVYALGLISDSVNVGILFSDSLATESIREAKVLEIFAMDRIYPIEGNIYGMKYKNFFLFAESRELLMSHQQNLSEGGAIDKENFPALPKGGIITGKDMQFSGSTSKKLGNGWRVWHYMPLGERTQVSLVGNGEKEMKVRPTPMEDSADDSLVVPEAPTIVEAAAKAKSVINHLTGKTDEIKYSGIKIEWQSEGKTIWTVTLSADIVGIEQIDAFKNGKKQLLILTESRLEMLDINGKNVSGFPVALASKPSTNLCIADYSSTRDYRILFGCSDGVLYNYMSNGKPTAGWNAARMKDDLPSSIQCVKVDGQNEIQVKHTSGKTTILKRNGTTK
jgi:hypothetical protein